jgi:predicted DNA-binding transcriptional regulator AlpA
MQDMYLSEREFSARYLVSPRTAQRMRVTGDGPKFVRLGARRVAYRVSDCESWAQSRTFAHRAEELSELKSA